MTTLEDVRSTDKPRAIMAQRIIEKRKDIPYSKEYPFLANGLPMITSKLTSKSQTTVPQSVRRALSLKPGDLLSYEISDGQVILTRARAETELDDPFGGFEEWRGKEDEHAYADL